MVVVRLLGGLGNQMFQYAAGQAVALRHQAPLLLDLTGFEQYDLRRFELHEFAISARPARDEELVPFRSTPPTRKSSLSLRILDRFRLFKPSSILREATFTYDSRIEKVTLPVCLDGYWQSEKYFSDIAPVIRREFTLKSEVDIANLGVQRQIQAAGNRSVSLHVRRGDYVSNPHTSQYHGVCTLEYYRLAVERIARQVLHPHFFVFSDDHEWVRENLHFPDYTMTQVQVNDPDHGIFDLTLMKSCAHQIIANSSFSWWGAWLNPSNEKIVIAPAQWFARAGNDTRDLLPASWIRL